MSEPEPTVEVEPEVEGEGAQPTHEPTHEPTQGPTFEPTSEPESLPESYAEGPMGGPQPFEVWLPPIAITLCMLVAIISLSLITQKLWWRRLFSQNAIHDRSNLFPEFSWLSYDDKVLIYKLNLFGNNPWGLIQLAWPALISMAFCPMTIFLYMPMVKMFWPPEYFDAIPDINNVIRGFLTPSGLVYAIAFGFAYQEAVAGQLFVKTQLIMVKSGIETIHGLLDSLTRTKAHVKDEILDILALEIRCWIEEILKIDMSKRTQSKIQTILYLLKEGQYGGKYDVLEKTYLKKIVKQVLVLDELRLKSVKRLAPRMRLLQWFFLETLAYMSFFGILMLDGDSYRIQLTLCIVTVAAISFFCFILADVDNPFHGFFRNDVTVLGVQMSFLYKHLETMNPGENPNGENRNRRKSQEFRSLGENPNLVYS